MVTLLRLLVASIVFFLFIIPKNSYAYLDPGTGSYLLQIIAAILFAGLFFIKSWWGRVKGIFLKLISKADDEEESSKKTKGTE